MALFDRPIVKRLLEEAEGRIGLTIQPAREVKRLRVVEQEYGEFQQEAEELAYHSMDYFGGRPTELRPERRRRLAQRSRIALQQDPLAGAEAQLLADFAFGKGISIPTAADPDVQDVIDSAWSDSINEQILTGYQAQRKLSNELLTCAELFITLYSGGGKIRVGRLDPDLVVNIVPDPENRNIPLWYVARQRNYSWDFNTDQPQFVDLVKSDAQSLQVKYWPHWRNAADALADRDRLGVESDEEPLVQPPAAKLAKGLVYPVAINQTGEQLRGTPPWARSLRFMSAMNVLTESHVAMAQAASTFVARRAMKGSPRQITKAAANILASAGELGASAFRPAPGWGVAGNAEPDTQPFTAPGTPGPFPPGSWWNENADASTLSALNLNSGAAQMTQTAQIVRAPIAATSGFGQHYLGDTSSMNLATGATLELPATMHIGAWQEYFEQIYRWFTDRAIEAAVQSGLLGGAQGYADQAPLGEMRLHEAEDRAEMEDRTGRDLSYKFSMPYPGRRQLADVTTFVQLMCAAMDPNGVNIPLRRILLQFAFEVMELDDVAGAVKDCIPDEGMPGGIGPQSGGASFAQASSAQSAAGQVAGATGAAAGAGANDAGEGQQPYGAKSGTVSGGGSAGEGGALEGLSPEAVVASLGAMQGAAGELFKRVLGEDKVRELVGAGSNGDGS